MHLDQDAVGALVFCLRPHRHAVNRVRARDAGELCLRGGRIEAGNGVPVAGGTGGAGERGGEIALAQADDVPADVGADVDGVGDAADDLAEEDLVDFSAAPIAPVDCACWPISNARISRNALGFFFRKVSASACSSDARSWPGRGC